ncbi:KipI antagonist, partial [Paenibacillus sp. GYB003]
EDAAPDAARGAAGGNAAAPFAAASWFVPPRFRMEAADGRRAAERVVRVVRGAEFERFTADSRERLFREPFAVRPQSDRMGCRLGGPRLALAAPLELLSEGVGEGTIQVPPDGEPIVLLADRQTIGGYPRIAHVAAVDIPLVAQTMPGETIRFAEIALAEAERLLLERERRLRALKAAIALRLSKK